MSLYGIKFLKQPTNTTCGQTCVAMLADCTVDEACAAVGTGGKTTTKQIIAGLRKLGLKCGDRRKIYRGERFIGCRLPDRVLMINVSVVRNKKVVWRHWAIYHARRYFDPATSVWPYKPPSWIEHDAQIRSYLEVDVSRLQRYYR